MPLINSGQDLEESSPLAGLLDESRRQLNICNSCRYCEGYCAVFPALERRVDLADGDIVYLANLCHDCRACLYACMYSPPHEFMVNPPLMFSELRRSTYPSVALSAKDVPIRGPQLARFSIVFVAVFVSLVACGAVLVSRQHSLSVLVRRADPLGSPYAIVTYQVLVIISLVLALASLVAMLAACLSYWRRTYGAVRDLYRAQPWFGALRDAATLRYLRGGAEGCYVKEGHASIERRILHGFVAYGFSLCVLATIAAAVEQDMLHRTLPFPVVSIPVLSGLIGGVGLLVGSLGLLRLKATQDIVAVDGLMTTKDMRFLVALCALSVTGIATLLTRSTSAFGIVLLVHLTVVWFCFVCAPVTKFIHFAFRLLALVQNRVEARALP